MKRVTEQTFWARVYIAGPQAVAEQLCREYCFAQGLCVTVEPTKFIYTGGEETGVVIGLVNYPRFPAKADKIFGQAKELAYRLIMNMSQHSALVMTPTETVWMTRRPEDNRSDGDVE
jgi:hypothetical protein